MWRVLCAGGAGIGFAARATIGVSQGAARTGRRARVPVAARPACASPERENGAPAARAAPADERGQVEELKVKGIRRDTMAMRWRHGP
eukprot:scaffold14681_cov78-Phaeocystis_antarctica.AAC.2